MVECVGGGLGAREGLDGWERCGGRGVGYALRRFRCKEIAGGDEEEMGGKGGGGR